MTRDRGERTLHAELLDAALAGGPDPELPELVELAALARRLGSAWAVPVRPEAAAAGRIAALAALGSTPARRAAGLWRAAGRVALAGAAVALLTGGALAASWPAIRSSLPGDALHRAKLAVEAVRVALARGPVAEAAVLLDVAEARLEEAVLARDRGRTEAEAEALRRYAAAVAAVRERLAAAAAQGLHVADVASRADSRFASHQELLMELIGSLPPSARDALAARIGLTPSPSPVAGDPGGRPEPGAAPGDGDAPGGPPAGPPPAPSAPETADPPAGAGPGDRTSRVPQRVPSGGPVDQPAEGPYPPTGPGAPYG